MTVKLRKDSQIPAYMAYPRFLLTAPYSDDRRKAASELAKKRGIHTKQKQACMSETETHAGNSYFFLRI